MRASEQAKRSVEKEKGTILYGKDVNVEERRSLKEREGFIDEASRIVRESEEANSF